MREIKFRAWYKGNDCMLYSYIPDEDEQGKREYFPWGFGVGFSHYDPKDLIIMQYTGLKDKKGTEIYEGDIISLTKMGWNKKSKYKYKHQIEWICNDSYATFVGWGYSHDKHLTPAKAKRCEVVGNIYETNKIQTAQQSNC